MDGLNTLFVNSSLAGLLYQSCLTYKWTLRVELSSSLCAVLLLAFAAMLLLYCTQVCLFCFFFLSCHLSTNIKRRFVVSDVEHCVLELWIPFLFVT